jgi:hypothetical protein
MDLSSTIIPKSDQLNADDLIVGPLTIKITAVEPGNAEQPVIIRYKGDNGHPYKPGKSMRRVLVAIWGRDGEAYVGRSLTLYCDPDITFGKDKTGGVRISHASDIPKAVDIALTVTRGRRKPFIVEPLVIEPADVKFDVVALTRDGVAKSAEGKEALAAWFLTLPNAAKKALKPTLDAEWKPAAEAADKKNAEPKGDN